MAKSITGLTSAKRFGPRYGRRVKELFENAEISQRQFHKCPYCHAEKVKRKSIGIWHCIKCKATFTGKAYVPYAKARTVTQEEEKSIEEEAEESEEADEETPEENVLNETKEEGE